MKPQPDVVTLPLAARFSRSHPHSPVKVAAAMCLFDGRLNDLMFLNFPEIIPVRKTQPRPKPPLNYVEMRVHECIGGDCVG